ncbi:MAG: AAA family ATPase [Acidaminococcaceae bacterium]|nr:AAA family ATPase [Acidaminococcaceae bacterium]
MKKLILINGTMGAGKTTTCQELLKLLQPCVFLDGDWCWNMNPFIVNEETKQIVVKNISFMLNNFIACSEFEYIIFCWVMQEESIIRNLLKNLNLTDTKVYKFTLAVSEEALTQRLNKDIFIGKRSPDVLQRSIERIPLYINMDTIHIDVSNISQVGAARLIFNYISNPQL